MPNVDLGELHLAYDWVAGGDLLDCHAVISRETGEIFCYSSSDLPPDEVRLPEDFEEGDQYVWLPGQHEFDLGTRLVWKFVREEVPQLADRIHDVFHGRGKYGRFKGVLNDAGRLQGWFAYEEAAQKMALRAWAESEGFTVVEKPVVEG